MRTPLSYEVSRNAEKTAAILWASEGTHEASTGELPAPYTAKTPHCSSQE